MTIFCSQVELFVQQILGHIICGYNQGKNTRCGKQFCEEQIMSNQPKFILWEGNEPHGKEELADITHAVWTQNCPTAFVIKKA